MLINNDLIRLRWSDRWFSITIRECGMIVDAKIKSIDVSAEEIEW